MSDVVSIFQQGLIFLNGFSGFVNVIGWDVFPLAFRFEVFITDFLCSPLNKNLIHHMLYPLLLCAYLQFLWAAPSRLRIILIWSLVTLPSTFVDCAAEVAIVTSHNPTPTGIGVEVKHHPGHLWHPFSARIFWALSSAFCISF